MSSINDFATTYTCQSLPFGGVKDSGFGRFAGAPALRGFAPCHLHLAAPRAARLGAAARPARPSPAPPRPAPAPPCAGIEGLRALCVPKAVCEDRLPWLMNTSIPKPWQVPVQDIAFPFATNMVAMFYGLSLAAKAKAVLSLAAIFLLPSRARKPKSS